MGNALNHGDMTIAEMSVAESYYSTGMTSESDTTTDEKSGSVASVVANPHPPTDIGIRNRNIGDDRLSNTSHRSQRTNRTSASRASTKRFSCGSDYDIDEVESKKQPVAPPPKPKPPKHQGHRYRSKSPKPRPIPNGEDESRTENSSAYHHGYRMQNENGEDDERDDIEFRSHEGLQGYEHALNYSPKPKYKEMLNNHPPPKNSGNHFGCGSNNPESTYINRKMNHQKGSSKEGSGRRYRSMSPRPKSPGVSGRVYPKSKPENKLPPHPRRRGTDANSRVESNGPSLRDIQPAETDMAYDGSMDEEEAQRIRDKEVQDHRYPEHQEEEIILRSTQGSGTDKSSDGNNHGPQHRRSPSPALGQHRRSPSPALGNQSRSRSQRPFQASQDESTLQQQRAAAQQLLEREAMRQESEDGSLLRQQQAAAKLLLQEQEKEESEDGSLLRQQQAAAKLLLEEQEKMNSGDGAENDQDNYQPMRSDSFSTLTKTLTTLPKLDAVPPAAKEKESTSPPAPEETRPSSPVATTPSPLAEQVVSPVAPGPFPVPVEEPVEAAKEKEDPEGPEQQQLQELLMQQQMQEEKLQKQLEQLRVQKERLQQLQEEKKQTASMHSKSSMEGSHAVLHQGSHQGSQHARSKELRIQQERIRAVKADPSGDGGNSLAAKSLRVRPSNDGSNHRDPSGDGGNSLNNSLRVRPSNDGSQSELFRATMEAAKDEYTRRRLAEAREKICPRSPNEGATHVYSVGESTPHSKIIQVKTASTKSEKSGKVSDTAAETTTEEIESSTPEYEDVPTHFKINGGRPHEENDMTTLSASLTHYVQGSAFAVDNSSTVSSMKPDVDLEGDQDDNDIGVLEEAVSSMDEEIDLLFVAKYDKAFNAFLDTYPALFDKNSYLIQNLKVAKLQKILEASFQTECDLEARLDAPNEIKADLEAEFRQKLKDASQKRAERTIQLQNELNQARKQSKAEEAKLTWEIFLSAVNRARKLYKINAEARKKGVATSPHELLSSLPDTNLMREVIQAVEAKPKDTFGEEQQKALHQYQVDNAFLSSEVRLLKEKISDLTNGRSVQDGLDRILVQMDSKTLKQLKSLYQKNARGAAL